MKKYSWWIAILAACFWGGCSDSNEKFFNDTASLYFDLTGSSVDSIVYSFAKTTATEHIVEIPVEIAGYQTDYDRKYKVVVDESRTTAKEGVHYKALDEYYVLPAASFTATLPVTIYATDRLLDTVQVYLQLKIEPTEDFGNVTLDRQQARIQVSNMLQKPSIWDQVYGPKYFGPYSRTKYKLILEVCQVDDLPQWGSANRQKMMAMGWLMQSYFKDHYPVYDENNQVIEYSWPISY